MASKNNLLGDILSSSPNFLSQLLFGLFLFIIARVAGASFPLSLFVGVMSGVSLGVITNANENNPDSTIVAPNDGIDAGLKYWLVFMLGCLFLGYSAPLSILFGGIAGLGGGWIISWWRSQETLQTQLSQEIPEHNLEEPGERSTKRRKRQPTRRFRRGSATFNFRFWDK
ncbi:MAG: hypothetical protein ACKO3K_03310 [Cuspidothrix sp.]